MHGTVRGDSAVDASGEIELHGEAVQSSDGAGGNRRHFDGNVGVLLMPAQDVLDTAEVGQHANGGFAVFAKRLDDAEVLDAVGLIGLERGHQLRISIRLRLRQEQFLWIQMKQELLHITNIRRGLH